jgi:plasmid stabilization system protein ParE
VGGRESGAAGSEVTLRLDVSSEACGDIREAVTWFRDVSPNLGVRFGVELERIYVNILEYPQMYPLVYKTFRRALLNRFPYSVFYVVEPSVVLIVAVVHQSRDEETWKRRA